MTAPAWTSDYVGLPYLMGHGECVHRAAEVWRDRFGWSFASVAANGDLRRAHRLIRDQMERPEWRQVAEPAEGDAVVMRKGSVLCHVGVWVEPASVLHCTRADGTILTPLDELPSQGFHVVGTFRHEEPEALPLAA